MLAVLALFYLCTAIIRGDGPGEELVFAPFHGLCPFYTSWEGGRWIGNRSPGYYVRMCRTSYETTVAPWLAVYIAGYVVGLPVLTLSLVVLQLRKKKDRQNV